MTAHTISELQMSISMVQKLDIVVGRRVGMLFLLQFDRGHKNSYVSPDKSKKTKERKTKERDEKRTQENRRD